MLAGMSCLTCFRLECPQLCSFWPVSNWNVHSYAVFDLFQTEMSTVMQYLTCFRLECLQLCSICPVSDWNVYSYAVFDMFQTGMSTVMPYLTCSRLECPQLCSIWHVSDWNVHIYAVFDLFQTGMPIVMLCLTWSGCREKRRSWQGLGTRLSACGTPRLHRNYSRSRDTLVLSDLSCSDRKMMVKPVHLLPVKIIGDLVNNSNNLQNLDFFNFVAIMFYHILDIDILTTWFFQFYS